MQLIRDNKVKLKMVYSFFYSLTNEVDILQITRIHMIPCSNNYPSKPSRRLFCTNISRSAGFSLCYGEIFLSNAGSVYLNMLAIRQAEFFKMSWTRRVYLYMEPLIQVGPRAEAGAQCWSKDGFADTSLWVAVHSIARPSITRDNAVDVDGAFDKSVLLLYSWPAQAIFVRPMLANKYSMVGTQCFSITMTISARSCMIFL